MNTNRTLTLDIEVILEKINESNANTFHYTRQQIKIFGKRLGLDYVILNEFFTLNSMPFFVF